MNDFKSLNVNKFLLNALDELGIKTPTPIQEESFPVILSGKNVVGIAQTGTGKTFAYALPILQELKFSKEINPTVLVLVPTRELVIQVVEQFEKLSTYKTVRIGGIYGGTNMKTQALMVLEGLDILVATPRRLFDLVMSGSLSIKQVKKLVIDEVDVMLDLGFKYQLTNIFEHLKPRRQNIMFSATMTEEVETLIHEFFYDPVKISIAVSGTPLSNITQHKYQVPNFYSKTNLLSVFLENADEYKKVLVFVPGKNIADRLHEELRPFYFEELGVIHSNMSQNNRMNAIEGFNQGEFRVLIATDVMARGLDLEEISHVINFDTPSYPENYIHRIGRTGRAETNGSAILFYSEKEEKYVDAIEDLMNEQIPHADLPEGYEASTELIPEEKAKPKELSMGHNHVKEPEAGAAFHEKSAKNSKVNLGSRYKREIKTKYKKPLTRGDKNKSKKKR